jgi:glycosyltransferase involved in cell wall biosynthesis
MKTSGKVFAYLGTVRPNRNPHASIVSFMKVAGSADRLVLAGMGLRAFLPESNADPRIITFDRFLLPDDYRDLICAADFVINDGERYLTSAVIRTALSYGVPVIAHPYGATLDMAQGAALFIGAEGVEGALREAMNMDRDRYELLCGEAHKRNDERSWEESGRKLDDYFRHVAVSMKG